jgi:hypothetical protein
MANARTRTAAAFLAAAVLFLLTACATRVGHVGPAPADDARVDHSLLMPQGQARYELDDLALFVMPMELASPAPAFPAGIPAGDVVPVTVCVETWLDDAGDVTRLLPARGVDGCPPQADAQAAPYEQAVVQAMRAWSFSAAAICRFPERLRAQRERGDCRGEDVALTHVPVRLTYAFTFERRAGRAQVISARLPGGQAAASAAGAAKTR